MLRVLGNLDKVLKILNRNKTLFEADFFKAREFFESEIPKSRFLVLGGAGSIGRAFCREIAAFQPLSLHIIDLSENALAETVRTLRCDFEKPAEDLQTLPIDVGSRSFENFIASQGSYDYVLNFTALKHVRSENDPFSIVRMIETNIFNTIKVLELTKSQKLKKYFCVSTDKASNPVNIMGATKRIMELFLEDFASKNNVTVSSARFANVAFSDGSILQSFENRLRYLQPIVAPSDIRRYFVTEQEAGRICLLSLLIGGNRDILFPKLDKIGSPILISDVATNFLNLHGYEVKHFHTEQALRSTCIEKLIDQSLWPCFFTDSDTTGEKELEEFFTEHELVENDQFHDAGVVKLQSSIDSEKLTEFREDFKHFKNSKNWRKDQLVNICKNLLPNFQHRETYKNLTQKL